MTVVISGRVYAADGDRAASIVADEGAEREGARDEGALLLLRLPLLVPRRSRSDTLTPPTSQAQRRRFDKTVANLANARTKVATLREKINTTSVPKLLEVCVSILSLAARRGCFGAGDAEATAYAIHRQNTSATSWSRTAASRSASCRRCTRCRRPWSRALPFKARTAFASVPTQLVALARLGKIDSVLVMQPCSRCWTR